METEVLENPTVEDIKVVVALMWEKRYVLYKTVKTDNFTVLYFVHDTEAQA